MSEDREVSMKEYAQKFQVLQGGVQTRPLPMPEPSPQPPSRPCTQEELLSIIRSQEVALGYERGRHREEQNQLRTQALTLAVHYCGITNQVTPCDADTVLMLANEFLAFVLDTKE